MTDTPDSPETPETPEASVTPVAPETLEAPVTPDAPNTLDTPETSDAADTPETSDVVDAPATATPQAVPSPAAPSPAVSSPAVPTPAMFARRHGTPDRSAFGRVGDDGQVYVTTADGERAVGSYPGASPRDALTYFARKYDELAAAADLLLQRVTHTDISAKDAADAYAKLVTETTEPAAVGDLAALQATVAQVGEAVEARRAAETEQRAAAREEARVAREALVAESERIAGQREASIQWKQSGARMRELLDEWKAQQRAGVRLDRPSEAALWQRFSAARNSFDRMRRVHFAQLDTQQGSAKAAKERLVVEAERLSTSKDWAPTAGAFKKLMDEWRQAGRAGRSDDDALWERFKAAQDAFFAAKDAVVAAEEEGFRANLAVKEQLITEADAILPVTDLERAKAALRSIQDRWDKAGKVPRADLERTEKALRRVEQAVRDVEDRRWKAVNPEAAARAQSLVDQLETAVAGLRLDLAKAEASGNAKKVTEAQSALDAREQWLAQARSGLEEFGG